MDRILFTVIEYALEEDQINTPIPQFTVKIGSSEIRVNPNRGFWYINSCKSKTLEKIKRTVAVTVTIKYQIYTGISNFFLNLESSNIRFLNNLTKNLITPINFIGFLIDMMSLPSLRSTWCDSGSMIDELGTISARQDCWILCQIFIDLLKLS